MNGARTTAQRLSSRKEVRFIVVGGVNTLVGYGVFAAAIFTHAHYFVAQICSTVVGMTCSYLLNKYFTFRQPGRSGGEILRFVLVYLASYLVNLLILWWLVGRLGMNAYVVGGITILVTALVSYVGHNWFTFPQRAPDAVLASSSAQSPPHTANRVRSNARVSAWARSGSVDSNVETCERAICEND